MSIDQATKTCPVGATAMRLAELCRQGQYVQAIEELHADDAVSIEPFAMPGFDQVHKGKEAIIGKIKMWQANTEVHSSQVDGPFPQPETGRFCLVFKLDATCKMRGTRNTMHEVALYTANQESGKIEKEEFFYMPMPAEACDDNSCCSGS